jgi:isopenicillin-N N-acyltransferase-like protein
MLHNHEGAPAAICRHGHGTLPDLERVTTIGSVIMEPAARRLPLAHGRPCESAHETVATELAQEVARR